jgi:hypothetical protein
MAELTRIEVERAFPPQLKAKATQELVDTLNNLSTDPELTQTIRDNFMSYSKVLKDGQYRVEDYLNAVAYVSFKIMGYNNEESYQRTFPQRYQKLVSRGATKKDISAYVAAYNKNKLVNLVLEQSIIPTWVLNQDAVQKAIDTQMDIMRNSQSDIARTQAANSILNHLKKPESQQVELNINTAQNDGLEQLKETMKQLAETQIGLINAGQSTKSAAQAKLIDMEAVDADVE